jgi:hypothetical protein
VRSVAFVIPMVLPSLNEMLRLHWAERKRRQEKLAQEVMVALSGPRHFPRPPFANAKVTVVRHSAGALDADNLTASCKPLCDVLCVNSPTHPSGLGIIEDDAPGKCELHVMQQRAGRGAGFTAVRVDELA